MKFTITLFLLMPLMALGQDSKFIKQAKRQDTLLNFKSENGNISFVKVYAADGLSTTMIKNNLVSMLSAKAKIKLSGQIFTENSIYGELNGFSNMDDADFRNKVRELGYIYPGEWTPLRFGIFGKIVIDIKDQKYRVTITDMSYGNEDYKFKFNDFMEKKGYWRDLKNEKSYNQIIEGNLIISKLFDLKNYKKEDF